LIWWLGLIISTRLVNVLTDRQRPSNSIIDYRPYWTIILPNTIKNLVITILGESLGDPA